MLGNAEAEPSRSRSRIGPEDRGTSGVGCSSNWLPRPPRSASPGRAFGDTAAEQHFQTRFGDAACRVVGGLGRRRQVTKDPPYLPGARVAQDRHREIAVAVQGERSAGARQRDTGQAVLLPGPHRQRECEGRAAVAIDRLRHGEAEGEELAATGGATGDPVLAG